MIVSACSATPHRNDVVILKTNRPELPASSRVKCDDPVSLPDKALSAREATGLWGKDRSALTTCETRRATAVATIDLVPIPLDRPVGK